MKNKIKKATLSTLSGAIIASNIPMNVFADVLEEVNDSQVSQVEEVMNPELEESGEVINEPNLIEENVTEKEELSSESIGEDVEEIVEEDKTDGLIVSETNNKNQTSEARVEQSDVEEKTVDKTQVIVEIRDANLEAVIRAELRKQTGDITQADMEKLEYLYAEESEISDLTGLEYAVNIRDLELSYNNISDITPLSNLKKVETLNLSYNFIQDIKAIEGMTKLENLGLSDNEITDISVLKNIKRASIIMLSNNNITDISALEGNTFLRGLLLDGNDIPTEAIEDLLQDTLKLQILGLSLDRAIDLSGLNQLIGFILTNSTIDKMSDFNLNHKLTELMIDSSEINDWNGLEASLMLISRTEIKDASQLGSYMQGLFFDNNLLDLSGFQEMNQESLILLIGQHTKQSVELFENRMDNPFIEVDGSYITDIDLPEGVTLSEDGSELIFENPAKGESYEFNAKSYGLAVSQMEGMPMELKATFIIAGLKTVEGELVVTENQLSDTEKEVTVEVVDTYYDVDKITLPDGTEIEGNKATFVVAESGDYEIKYVDKEGNEFTKIITIEIVPIIPDVPEVDDTDKPTEDEDVDKPVEDEEINKPTEEDKEEVEKPTVNENEAPVIIGSNVSIPVGYELDLMTLVTATDKEDGKLDVKIKSSDFNNQISGTYYVTYEATDSKGLTTEKTIEITVRGNAEGNSNHTKDIVIKPNEKLDIESIVDEIAKDKGLTDVEIIENNVDETKPGDYKVVFEGTNIKKEQEIHSIKVTVTTGGTTNDSVETGIATGGMLSLGGLFMLGGIPFLRRKNK